MHVAWIWFWLRNIEKKALFSDLHHTAPLLTDKNNTCSKKGETVWCSSFSLNEWQMPSRDRKEELPYYQMSRSQLKRKSWEQLHTFGSFQNKERQYQGHRHCSSARTICNKTCSTLHTHTHRGSRSRPDYCLDCSVENKPQMTLLSVCNITSILPPSNSHLTS